MGTLHVTIRNSLTNCLVFSGDDISEALTVRELQDLFSRDLPMKLFSDGVQLDEGALLGEVLRSNRGLASGAPPEGLRLSVALARLSVREVVEATIAGRALRNDDLDILNELAEHYQVVGRIGKGHFAHIYRGLRKGVDSEELVAIKQLDIDSEEDGIPVAQLREVSLMKQMDHPNIIRLLEVHMTSFAIFLVYEHLDVDLWSFLQRTPDYFVDGRALVSAARQCSEGLHHCHVQRIVHRDLKPQNVLMRVKTMTMKLADFGMARSFSLLPRLYTPEVVTLWYRAPELLLGERTSSTALDIWSLGCLCSEMATSRPLFPGDSEIGTLLRIFRARGTPNESVWPGVTQLQHFQSTFPQWQDTRLAEVAAQGPALGERGIDLILGCLAYVPQDRLTSRRVLMHDFLRQGAK